MSNTQDPHFIEPGISRVEEMSARLIALNLELERKNQLLKASEQAREHILSNISHDLRAPLTAVRGALDRLLGPAVGEEERCKLIGIIDRRVASLERLVGELYISQKLDQPEFKLRLEHLSIAPFLQEYFITLETAGAFRDREAVLSIPVGFDACSALDAQHFLRILDNLISNALRHTAPGERIELGCLRSDEGVQIYLSDTGEGVKPEDMPYIFDRTYTSSSARTPEESGSGLGLYLAKLIAEKHGGTISCKSDSEKGATFTITLPESE